MLGLGKNRTTTIDPLRDAPLEGSIEMILPYRDAAPRLASDVYVHASAHVIGDVEIGPASSVWIQAVIRADVERVRIGSRTNVQDHATIHVTHDRWPTILGDGVTVGHRVVLHGCTVGDYALIGIGAIVLDGAEVGAEALVGAGALVAPGSKIPPRTLVLGSPAKPVRDLNADEIARLHRSAELYVGYAKSYRDQGL
jgi:carbonic anhydrase/acetyltransferase-like protein (isoleucine patch superfamily)